jgi:hypothetical protein
MARKMPLFTPVERAHLYAIAAAQSDLEEAERRLRAVKEQSALDWFQSLGSRGRRLAQSQSAVRTLRKVPDYASAL